VAILNRAVKNAAAMFRASEFGSSAIPPNSLADTIGGLTHGGGEQSALAIGTVLACVKALHDDFKVLPFAAYEGDKHGPREVLAKQPQIVTEPFGPDLEPSAGFGQLAVSDVFRGNAYCFVTASDRIGMPTQLMILHPDKVKPKRDPETGRKYFQVGPERYGTDRIKHITGMMLPGAVAGVDILTYQRITHDLAWKVNAYADGFFGNSAMPAGVISVPGSGDRKKAREVKEGWENNHAGIPNAHRPAVLFGGATWTPMTVSPENAQFLQTRRFLREELCGIYNVPLQRIQAIVENASQGGGKGLDAIDAAYVKHGLLPLANDFEAVWDSMIPGGQGTFTKFNLDVFLRASAEIRAQVAQIHRVSGIRTADEIRGDEGWAPLPNGMGSNPQQPLNSNASPIGGADNAPAAGGEGGNA
jgi:HK97 family phage portal protein